MTPNGTHDDALDRVIRSRQRTGHAAVDALNSTVPHANPDRRDALEQRLLTRVHDTSNHERDRTMIWTPALSPHYAAPRRIHISTSLLLTAAVFALCTAVLVFAKLTPPDDSPPAAAPIMNDQEQDATPPPTGTPVPFEPTGPPMGAEQATAVMQTDVPQADGAHTATATPLIPSLVSTELSTATPILPVMDLTATVVPADVDWPVPSPVRLSVDREAQPSVWFPASANVSERQGSGLLVAIPRDRFIFTDMGPAFAAGQTGRINLFTAVGVPPGATISAVVDGDLALAWVPIAQSAQLLHTPEMGDVIVWVSMEQGIVLNWLLHDTLAPLYYEPAR